jgi:hypothetical protein
MTLTLDMAQRAWSGMTLADHFYSQMITTFFAGEFERRGLGHDAGPLWQVIGFSQEMTTRLDLAATFSNAIDLVMLSEIPDDDGSQQLTVWLQGNGLQQLTDERLSAWLTNFVKSDQGELLLKQLAQFVEYPIPYEKITSKHDLGYFPECYRTFITVSLTTNIPDLEDNPAIIQLKEKAATILRKPDFLKIVDLYASIFDTTQFANQLKQGIK